MPAGRAVSWTRLIFISIVTVLTNLGCGARLWHEVEKANQEPDQKIVMPKDEATESEKAQIEKALNEISDLTEKFGKRREFKSMPIIVTSESARELKRTGYCMRSNAPFIAINRAVIIDNPLISDLATTILHEIGHCYFGLGHRDEWISKPGFSFIFYKTDPQHRGSDTYPKICTTIMCSNGLEPAQLLEYYVGVLLGEPKAKSVEDLERFTELNYIAD